MHYKPQLFDNRDMLREMSGNLLIFHFLVSKEIFWNLFAGLFDILLVLMYRNVKCLGSLTQIIKCYLPVSSLYNCKTAFETRKKCLFLG